MRFHTRGRSQKMGLVYVIILSVVFLTSSLTGIVSGTSSIVSKEQARAYVPSSITDFSLVSLSTQDFVEHANARKSITLPWMENKVIINLVEDDIIAPDGSEKLKTLSSQISTYSGKVWGNPDSIVRFSVSNSGIEGYISFSDDTITYEPLSRYMPGVSSLLHIAYIGSAVRFTENMADDIAPPISEESSITPSNQVPAEVNTTTQFNESGSGYSILRSTDTYSNDLKSYNTDYILFGKIADVTKEKSKAKKNESGKSEDPRYNLIRIGIYSDQNYCNRGGTLSSLIDRINELNGIYMNQENSRFELYDYVECISGSSSWSNDPSALLGQFNTWCVSRYECRTMDISHLATGKTLSHGLGIAYQPGGTSLSKQIDGSSYQRKIVMAHEIGHNFYGREEDAVKEGYKWTIMFKPYMGDSQMIDHYSNVNALSIKSEIMWRTSRFINYYAGPDTSWDNVELRNWQVSYDKKLTAGTMNNVYTSYGYKNVGSTTITFNYIFIGCRNPEPNNCDYGYSYSIVLTPGSVVGHNQLKKFSSAATTDLWPAYNIVGSPWGPWGPYRWQYISIPVVSSTLSSQPGPYINQDNVKLSQWTIRASNFPARVNTQMEFSYYYENLRGSDMEFNPYGILIGCLTPSQTSCDFGHQIVRIRTSALGGGYRSVMLVATFTPTVSGYYTFWPAYFLDGHWSPYQWRSVSTWIST